MISVLQVEELLGKGYGRKRIATELGISESKARKFIKQIKSTDIADIATEPTNENEILLENIRLKKQLQKAEDTNRIERKAFRSQARMENIVGGLTTELIKLLKEHSLHIPTPELPHLTEVGGIGIIHWTDHHYNELINIPGNKYDFTVASKRLKLDIDKAINWFIDRNVQHVLIAMTGDMLNSDRRVEELIEASTNRATAVFLAVDLLQQAIQELRVHFKLTVAYVPGNESRCPQDVGWAATVASDSYDTMIFYWLENLFMKDPEVTFTDCGTTETIVKLGDKHILLLHGHGKMERDIESSVERAKGRYASKGIIIDYVLLGHLHSCRIGDTYARGSSLAGANAYSEYGLNLTGKASQNLFVIDTMGRIDGMKVDLQNTDDINGYEIESSIATYNAKSADKIRRNSPIFEIKI
jgi:predicted phosphodiesterase/transposase-like protein